MHLELKSYVFSGMSTGKTAEPRVRLCLCSKLVVLAARVKVFLPRQSANVEETVKGERILEFFSYLVLVLHLLGKPCFLWSSCWIELEAKQIEILNVSEMGFCCHGYQNWPKVPWCAQESWVQICHCLMKARCAMYLTVLLVDFQFKHTCSENICWQGSIV